MLLATVLLWALNFTVTKYVLTHGFRPLAYSVLRYGAATTLFCGITFVRERSFRVHRSGSMFLLAGAAVVLWLNQLGYVYALKFSTASTVALILGTTPIFVAVFARVVGLERLSSTFWIAALVSFGGAALIALGESGGLSANVKGNALAVGTAASWAAYSVAIAPLMRDYSPYRISAIVLVGCWLLLAAAGGYQIPGQRFDLGWLTWVAFAYAVVGPLVITNVLWFTSIDRVGPSRASLFANLQPFFAAVIALILLSEHMTGLQIAGGFLIAAGIVLERRSHIPVPPPGAGVEATAAGTGEK
jgi:drug/metabolite transporter (DMT)-like permease